MADTQETIVDIIAKMRQGMNPNGTAECQNLESDICMLADRLDRARMKMEIEIANLRKANAKLRDALVTIQNCDIGKEEDCITLYSACEAALATASNQNTQEDNQ